MSRVLIPSKYTGESRQYIFDFTSRLDAGVTVVSGAVLSAVFSGTDPSPGVLVSGGATAVNAGTALQQKLIGGVPGVIYDIAANAVLSDGSVQTLQAFLTVLPAQP